MLKAVLFVCEHGAAKSVVAAAHFNRLAGAAGLMVRAVARGTDPDATLTPQAVAGLVQDGLKPVDDVPVSLTSADITAASRVIAFGPLPPSSVEGESWTHIPAVSEDYARARDAMMPGLQRLVRELAASE